MKNTKLKSSKTSPPPISKTAGKHNAVVVSNLIAVVGISPAILTETVWALAQGVRGLVPIIPDTVVAITTLKGRESIKSELLTISPDFGGQTVWQALRKDLLGSGAATDPRLTLRVALIERRDPTTGLTESLLDIRDRDHNLAAAEFILGRCGSTHRPKTVGWLRRWPVGARRWALCFMPLSPTWHGQRID